MMNLNDPSKLGEGIAVAFVATVYGVGSANLLFLPISNKLIVRHRDEMILREMTLEGVLAISTGGNPRLLREQLVTYVPITRRVRLKGKSLNVKKTLKVKKTQGTTEERHGPGASAQAC
jgi:flagellar motor component MotA